jgi:MraZ protein
MKFRGRFEYSIDPKGRINIPASFRERLATSGSEKIVLTQYDGCVYGFPTEEWSRMEDGVAGVSSVDGPVNLFIRSFFGSAVEMEADKQGRILVPPSLRGYAALEKDVVILGMLRRFEIWSLERWQSTQENFEQARQVDPELMKRIRELGI